MTKINERGKNGGNIFDRLIFFWGHGLQINKGNDLFEEAINRLIRSIPSRS